MIKDKNDQQFNSTGGHIGIIKPQNKKKSHNTNPLFVVSLI